MLIKMTGDLMVDDIKIAEKLRCNIMHPTRQARIKLELSSPKGGKSKPVDILVHNYNCGIRGLAGYAHANGQELTSNITFDMEVSYSLKGQMHLSGRYGSSVLDNNLKDAGELLVFVRDLILRTNADNKRPH